jgi:death on curing protein
MRHLSLGEIVELQRALIEQTGGAAAIRDFAALESRSRNPGATFDGRDLHATIVQTAAALGFSLALNHPFVDGNKRVAHAAMEVFLFLNGYELSGTVTKTACPSSRSYSFVGPASEAGSSPCPGGNQTPSRTRRLRTGRSDPEPVSVPRIIQLRKLATVHANLQAADEKQGSIGFSASGPDI